jgi:UDP-N-acetylmuramoyl-tripeptide--D-alanyl-D-alanine ligase
MEAKDLYSYFLKSTGVTTDSRKIEEGTLFICLRGEHFNGNRFAEEALEKGASYVVVDDSEYFKEDKRYIIVEDCLKSLQTLAHHHRMQFSIPVIGLTGSNGKTTTKELINSVLSQQFNTTATVGNLNNHIGVPLTLLNINSNTAIALIEMGANHLKEIELLAAIAAPTHGYITNFGKAHLEGFGSIEGVVRGKSELYHFLAKNKGVCLINSADPIQVSGTQNQKTFSFGTSDKAAVTIQNIDRGADQNIVIRTEETEIISQLKGAYNFTNIAAAIAFGYYFKIPVAKIKKGIEAYNPTNNRSQWHKTDSNTLVLDAYNANPSSMKAALESFFNTKKEGCVLILGDMLELGSFADEEHQKIVDLIETKKVAEVLLIGPEFNKTKTSTSGFKKFNSSAYAIPYLQEKNFQNKTILIKGSRGIALEVLKDYL